MDQMRGRPLLVSYSLEAPTADYTLEGAVKAREEMAKIGYTKMLELLLSPGQVCKLYYPGIGVPRERPGGDTIYVARGQLWDLLEAVRKAGHGHGVYVTGAKGIGKSCCLRALAWLLILGSEAAKVDRRVICLWSMLEAYKHLVGEMVAALRFTYCLDTDVLKVIDGLRSLQDVENFLQSRLSLCEDFYFIVDGVEALDADDPDDYSTSEQRLEAETALQRLLTKARVTVCGVSPMALESQKRKVGWDCVHFDRGFSKEEYDAYLGRVSLLGKLDLWQDDIDYFAGVHPLSLAFLDTSCRLHARNRSRSRDGRISKLFSSSPTWMKDEQIVELLLQDKNEWAEVLKLLVSSTNMHNVRAQANDTAENLDFTSGYPSQASMMEMDTTYVLGDPPTDYVTPYIRSIYTKAFRDAESRAISIFFFSRCRVSDEKVDPGVWYPAPKR